MNPPVEAPASRQRRPSTVEAEGVERADQLVRAARHPGVLAEVRDGQVRADRGIAVAGLAASMPSMLTRPAPISSAACWRDRARPRRTSSASTRARRVTRLSPSRPIPAPAPGDRAPPPDAPRRRRGRDSVGSVLLAQQVDDLGADLVGIGSHVGVHASRSAADASDQRSRACRAVSSPAEIASGRPSMSAAQTAAAIARTTDSSSPVSSPVQRTATVAASTSTCQPGVRPDALCVGVGGERAQILREVVGPLRRDRPDRVLGGVHPAQHHQAGQLSRRSRRRCRCRGGHRPPEGCENRRGTWHLPSAPVPACPQPEVRGRWRCATRRPWIRCRAAVRAPTAGSCPRWRRPTARRTGWPAPPRRDRASRSAGSAPAPRRPEHRTIAAPAQGRRR